MKRMLKTFAMVLAALPGLAGCERGNSCRLREPAILKRKSVLDGCTSKVGECRRTMPRLRDDIWECGIMRFLVVLPLLLLVGCASSSSITATPFDGNGGPYYGTVQNMKKGKFQLEIDGNLYQGYWHLGLSPQTGFQQELGEAEHQMAQQCLV